jgi:hypothetical protein
MEIIKKDNNFSLFNCDNYKKDFDCDISKIIHKYSQLIIEYGNFINENIKVKNLNFVKFIIIRGLDTITNVFNYILYVTKNLDLTYYHCQKSFYFYIEFVGQITEDDKMFLKLTTRDAVMYVYKKTIFDIENEVKKLNKNTSPEFKEKIEIISNYIKLYQIYLLKIIQTNKTNTFNDIEHLLILTDNLKSFSKNSTLIQLEKIADKLYYRINDVHKFFEINNLIIKSILKNPNVLNNMNEINNKLELDLFNDKMNENCDVLVKWLLF